MRNITIAYDEELMSEVQALDLISKSIAYKQPVVSLNVAYPEHGSARVETIVYQPFANSDEKVMHYTIKADGADFKSKGAKRKR